jgi:SET domain-containing protein
VNNISVHNGSIVTSSVRTTTAVSNGHGGGIKTTATPKAAPKKSHIRSIKELSSALNLSASLSTSFSVSMMANNSHHHHHHLIQKCNSNRKITDYFQVRKSSRKCKSDLDKERRQFIEQAIKSGHDLESDSLEVRVLPDKGRAIFAARPFRRGEFVCEYAGEMIAYAQAKKREEAYAQDPSIGCYMYFFEYKSKPLCIDATSETSRLGRLLNHSKLDGNCQAKLFETEARPYIILVAARDIRMGEELTYDYGERNKTAIEAHPWLAT